MTESQEGECNDMHCENAREAVSAAMDDELAVAQTTQLKRHLQECEPCRDYARQSQLLFDCLAEELSDQKNTDALWRRVSDVIDDEQESRANVIDLAGQSSGPGTVTPTEPAANDVAPVWARRRFMIGGAAAALLLTAGGAAIERTLNSGSTEIVTETINDFLTFRASGRKLHIAGGEPAEIRTWLLERVNFDIPIKASPPKGFRLAGGRLCSFLNRRLVFLHYEQGDHAVSLYVMNEEGLKMPAGGTRRIGNRDVLTASSKGVTNVVWHDEGLVYAVVSDLAEAQVLNFVTEI